ncbi:MAG: hypothetical protein ACOCQR_01865 [bacterium]
MRKKIIIAFIIIFVLLIVFFLILTNINYKHKVRQEIDSIVVESYTPANHTNSIIEAVDRLTSIEGVSKATYLNGTLIIYYQGEEIKYDIFNDYGLKEYALDNPIDFGFENN